MQLRIYAYGLYIHICQLRNVITRWYLSLMSSLECTTRPTLLPFSSVFYSTNNWTLIPKNRWHIIYMDFWNICCLIKTSRHHWERDGSTEQVYSDDSLLNYISVDETNKVWKRPLSRFRVANLVIQVQNWHCIHCMADTPTIICRITRFGTSIEVTPWDGVVS